MHGILFKYLKEYVEEEWDHDAWEEAMDVADIEPKLYLPVTEYPDDEALRLIDGVVEVTGVEESELLEDYGERLAPELLDTFNAHIKDAWGPMDLLAHPENEVFEVLRSEVGDGEEMAVTREDDDTVRYHYSATLEMCELAKGVLRGLVEAQGEDVEVSEGDCMHDGADSCEITVVRG